MKNQTTRSNWLTTFNDLLSLLLTFFILIYSMSSVEMDSFDKILGKSKGQVDQIHEQNNKATNYMYISTVNRLIHESVVVRNLGGKMSLSFRADTFFEDTGTSFSREATQLLATIGEIIFDMRNQLNIKNQIRVDIINNIVHDGQITLDDHGDGLLKALAITEKLINIGMSADRVRSFSMFSSMQKMDQNLRHNKDEQSFHRLDFVIHLYD